MAATITVTIDRDRCVGAGMCALTAPEVFDQDTEDGRVVLLISQPPHQDHAATHEATVLCPARAITVTVTEQREPDGSSTP
ncbi:ferredoxin [Streptomyces sp. NPDC017993]|uniref:ferredoxin n=1 Tax=Streptomyces sp. NPDC017993 TaxID=3365027 RepID=UPI0037B27993